MNLKNLIEIERETYELIKDAGEIMTGNLPDRRMLGIIPDLKNKGLVEVYKKYTIKFRRRKKKFVKIKDNTSEDQK